MRLDSMAEEEEAEDEAAEEDIAKEGKDVNANFV